MDQLEFNEALAKVLPVGEERSLVNIHQALFDAGVDLDWNAFTNHLEALRNAGVLVRCYEPGMVVGTWRWAGENE